jgi:predicted class III extradiol MEMO1 family dioxygenase
MFSDVQDPHYNFSDMVPIIKRFSLQGTFRTECRANASMCGTVYCSVSLKKKKNPQSC